MTPPRRRVTHNSKKRPSPMPASTDERSPTDPEVISVHKYSPPEDVFTNPISLGLRIGQPAVASPETTDLPVWAGKPDVPAPTVQHHPRRSLALWLLDEGVLLVLLVAGLFGLSALIAVYVR